MTGPRDNRGLHPVTLFRASCWLHRRGRTRLAHALKAVNFVLFRAVLPPEVRAGRGLQMNHRGLGVVLHPNTELGEDVRLQHHVTIANRRYVSDREMTVIGDRVEIGAGAIVLGPLTIGDDATIGAGAVVTRPVPAAETWAGNPARRLGSRQSGG